MSGALTQCPNKQVTAPVVPAVTSYDVEKSSRLPAASESLAA